MLYLGIDQHKAQITMNLRNEQGDVIQQCQVSTDHAKIDDFFAGLKKQAAKTRGFMAILEVCGFNHWLLKKLEEYGCKEIVLMQPDKTSNKKTDRRDANALCELLWNNRKRLQNGERPNGIRRITVPTQEEAETRQLANLRQYFVKQRTKCINKIRGVLRKHNMEQDAPSDNFKTKKIRDWLKQLKFASTVDRLEIEAHLNFLEECGKQIVKIEHEMATRAETDHNVLLLASIPGISHLGALTLLSRIGDIERFPTPDSLANYFGLTPSCRNSGEATQRHGSITKAGSSLARNILNTAVNHVVRKDKAMKDWHKKIKKRRGAKIARVAVMRRLATIVWHILKRQTTYQFRYEAIGTAQTKTTSHGKSRSGFLRHDSGVPCVVEEPKKKSPVRQTPGERKSALTHRRFRYPLMSCSPAELISVSRNNEVWHKKR
jgi:transposase